MDYGATCLIALKEVLECFFFLSIFLKKYIKKLIIIF
jgi:hypothetical protein